MCVLTLTDVAAGGLGGGGAVGGGGQSTALLSVYSNLVGGETEADVFACE